MIQDDEITQQTNIGKEQRVAGRDFYDQSTTHHTDLRLFMLTAKESDLDTIAIDNGDYFITRFGKDYNSSVRQAIVSIKQNHNFTAREIKHLLKTNGISIDKIKNTAKLNPDFYRYYFGWLLILFIFVNTAFNLCLVTFYSHSTSWRITLAQLTITAVCIACLWFYNWIFIAPHHILKRSYSAQV